MLRILLLTVLTSSTTMLSGQMIGESDKKSPALKPKVLSEHLIIIDNSTGYLGQELALDALRESADSLGQSFDFLTIFQGMYLHLGGQPDEKRFELQDYNIGNLEGIDDGQPTVALFVRYTQEGKIAVLEDRVIWGETADIYGISTEKQGLIQALALEAANILLQTNPNDIVLSANEYIETFLEELNNPPRHFFYINGDFFGPEDIVYLPKSLFTFPIKIIKEEEALVGDTTSPVESFVWERGELVLGTNGKSTGVVQTGTNSILPKNISANKNGAVISAKFEGEGGTKEVAATRVVVVDVDLNQEITSATYPADFNELLHYHEKLDPGLYRIGGCNEGRFKYLPRASVEKIEVKVNPKGVPADQLKFRSGTNLQSVFLEGNNYFVNLSSIFGGNHRVDTILVGKYPLRKVDIQMRETFSIPILFVLVHTRKLTADGAVRNIKTPGNFSANKKLRMIEKANEIFNKIGGTLIDKGHVNLTIDDQNHKIEYVLSDDPNVQNLEELNLIFQSSTADSIRQKGMYPVFIVRDMESSSDNRATGQEVGGITRTSEFISIISLGAVRTKSSLGRDLAHEVGHGYLSLRHPWDLFKNFKQGDDEHNLMDYNHGETQLYFRAYQFSKFSFKPISVP